MSAICCNHVSKNTSNDLNKDSTSTGHSPTHPHRDTLHVSNQSSNLVSAESEEMRKCLKRVADIPMSELDQLKMPART